MKNPIGLLLGAFTLIRLLVASQIDLGADEAHYILYGLHPDLSYFDHPPLVGWVQILFANLGIVFPSLQNVIYRLPAIISGFFSSYLIYHWLLKRQFSSFQSLWAVFGLNLCLLYEGLTLFFLPDSILLFLTPLLVLHVEKLEKQKTLWNWIVLGVLLGLCGLSKYTAFLFVVALAARWVQLKYYKDVFRTGFWFALAISGIVILPILVWNQSHEWMSFKYQTNHVMSWSSLDPKTFAAAQFSQFVGLGFFYIYSAISLWHAFKNTKKYSFSYAHWLVFCTATFLYFFSIFGNFLPHWTAPAFILGIPLGIAEALKQEHFNKTLKTAFTFALILFLVLNSELILKWLPTKISQNIYRDIQGWPPFIRTVADEAKSKNLKLGVTNWSFGSRFMLYSPFPKEVLVVDKRKDQFDLWNPLLEHENYLLLVENGKQEEFFGDFKCGSLKNLGPRNLEWRSEILVSFQAFDCQDLQGQ